MFACKRRDNFHVKLIDFGLAREVGGLGRARCGMVGTVEFMSPEVRDIQHSHWSSFYIAVLSLVEICRVVKYFHVLTTET